MRLLWLLVDRLTEQLRWCIRGIDGWGLTAVIGLLCRLAIERTDCVVAARVPHDPLGQACVVDRLLLCAHLRCGVARWSEREVLQPWANGCSIRHARRALRGPRHGGL